MKILTSTLLAFGALTLPFASVAQSYQIEAQADLIRTKFDFDNSDATVNVLNLGARYHLEQVETVGPWGESAFLNKSSWAGIQLTRTSGDVDGDTDFTLDAHYVTPDDLILGGELSSSDATDLSVFGGKYLDDRTTVIGRVALGDTDSLGVEYRTLMQLGSGNDLAVQAGFSFLDAADSGFELDGEATYYLSDQIGILAGLSFLDIGDFDETTFSAGAEYFLSETLAARGGLSIGSSDSRDSTAILIGVVSRF